MGIFSDMLNIIQNKFSYSKKEDIPSVNTAPKTEEAVKPQEQPKNNYQHLEKKLTEMSDPQYNSVIQAGKKLLSVMNISQKPSQKTQNDKYLQK